MIMDLNERIILKWKPIGYDRVFGFICFNIGHSFCFYEHIKSSTSTNDTEFSY
jgi:hypothetical protein